MTTTEPSPPGSSGPASLPDSRPTAVPAAPLAVNGAAIVNGAVAAPPRVGAREGRRARFSIRTFTSLADPNYRWYFLSLLGHFASMNMQMFIRSYLVFQLTGSYAMLGVISLANAIPGLFMSLVGGVVADRVSQKKHVIQAMQVVSALQAGVIAALLFADALRVEHLIAAAVIQGGSNSLMMPSRQALTNEIVGRDRLMNALALNNAGMNVARLMMPALAGFLVAVIGSGHGTAGAEWVYFLMTALYLGSLVTLFKVRNEFRNRPIPTPWTQSFRQLSEGLGYIRRSPTIRLLLIVNILVVMCAMPYFMLLAGFAEEVLGANSARLGLLISVQGIGSLVGSLVIASLPNRRRGRLLLISSFALGVSLLFFSWSTWYFVTLGIMVGVGLGQAGRMSLSQVLVQSYSEDQYRGRVLSIHMMEMSLTQLGTFVVALIANEIGPQLAIGGTAVGLIAITLYLWFFVPTYRNLD